MDKLRRKGATKWQSIKSEEKSNTAHFILGWFFPLSCSAFRQETFPKGIFPRFQFLEGPGGEVGEGG